MVRPPNLISEDSKTFFQTELEPITACHPAQKQMSIDIPVISEQNNYNLQEILKIPRT